MRKLLELRSILLSNLASTDVMDVVTEPFLNYVSKFQHHRSRGGRTMQKGWYSVTDGHDPIALDRYVIRILFDARADCGSTFLSSFRCTEYFPSVR